MKGATAGCDGVYYVAYVVYPLVLLYIHIFVAIVNKSTTITTEVNIYYFYYSLNRIFSTYYMTKDYFIHFNADSIQGPLFAVSVKIGFQNGKMEKGPSVTVKLNLGQLP